MQDYEEIFLERADLMKYQLYSLLARPYVKDVSITDLATLLHAKYQPIYNVFQELLDDIVMLTAKPREEMRAALLAAERLPLSLDTYRAHLVRQGIVFRIVDYVVQQPHPTLNQFCDQEYISRSTITRKLKPFNQLLSNYGVKLKLASFTFAGSEFNIRYCLYSVYWWAFRGISWPFTSVKRADIVAEVETIGLDFAQPLARLQQQYFLGLSHLRVAKSMRIEDNAFLAHFEQALTAQKWRTISLRPPFSWLDTAAFNFFELSQPRFDLRITVPKAATAEIAVLTDPAVAVVSDRLVAALHAKGSGDLDDDLYLNLLRLIAGYILVGGAFPQGQDYIGGGHETACDHLIDLVEQVVAELPQTATYEGFRQYHAHFSYSIARLVTPMIPEHCMHDQLHVRLAIDPVTEGYQALAGFVQCVPWIAAVSKTHSDLVIATGEEAQDVAGRFMWYANALDLPIYQERLIEKLIEVHTQKGLADEQAS